MLAGSGRVSICGDASTLRERLAHLADLRPPLVISWGVCGGLDPRLRPGDLIVGSEVVSGAESIRTDEFVALSIEKRLINAGARAVVERLAGANAPVLTARAKAKLRTATGAAAVDTESLSAGRFALAQGARFAILRAVSDPADQDLPLLALKAVDADGRVKNAAVIRDLIRSPGQFIAVLAAARHSKAAFRALDRACRPLASVFLALGLEHP